MIVPSVNSAVLLALYGDLEDLFGGDLEGLFGVTFLGDFLRNGGLVLATIFGLLLRSSTGMLKEKQPLIKKLMQSHSHSNRCQQQVTSKRHNKNVPYLQEYK